MSSWERFEWASDADTSDTPTLDIGDIIHSKRLDLSVQIVNVKKEMYIWRYCCINEKGANAQWLTRYDLKSCRDKIPWQRAKRNKYLSWNFLDPTTFSKTWDVNNKVMLLFDEGNPDEAKVLGKITDVDLTTDIQYFRIDVPNYGDDFTYSRYRLIWLVKQLQSAVNYAYTQIQVMGGVPELRL